VIPVYIAIHTIYLVTVHKIFSCQINYSNSELPSLFNKLVFITFFVSVINIKCYFYEHIFFNKLAKYDLSGINSLVK